MRRIEGPTWIMLALCYGGWGAIVWHWDGLIAQIGWVGVAILAGYCVALHASLQHEALHGHPTRSCAINEALVFPSLNLLIPYRRFRQLHLQHHRDERLTDPYDDPETWYLAEKDWRSVSPPLRVLLRANQTLLGRMLIGPWLSMAGLYRADIARGEARVLDAYLRHGAGVALVLGYVWGVCGVSPIAYLLLAAWPGLAFLMLRTFAEHRAAGPVAARTAIVEAETPFALLFLNNNLHSVHHRHPTVPWYALPEIYARDRTRLLAENEGYLLRGYRDVAARWLFAPKEPVRHPWMRRESVAQASVAADAPALGARSTPERAAATATGALPTEASAAAMARDIAGEVAR